jgi:hypothetical protein
MHLSATETRILGALIEKASTTPDVYPLSLNALTTACNQTTNRDPVMTLDENAVRWAINSLRQQSLVRAIQPSDSRVMKYQHLLAERLDLEAPALAVMCVLMLRGPQTLGEIKTRTARLAEFAGLADVDTALNDLIRRNLATELPRRPGQKEIRYAQLLSGPVSAGGEAEATDAADVTQAPQPVGNNTTALDATVAELRRELDNLRAEFDEFRRELGGA